MKTPPKKTIKSLVFILSAVLAVFSVPKGFAEAEILSKTDAVLTVEVSGKTFEYFYPEIDSFCGKLYLKNIDEAVEDIYYASLVPPENAEIIFHPSREEPFEFKKEKAGLGVDKRALFEGIGKVLAEGGGRFSATEFVKVEPQITVNDLKAYAYKRGEFSTYYGSSSAQRKKNVALAVKLLGVTEIYNGEEFSFNSAVGERTEERGFLSAKVIENGKFTEGVGGGVCQVSSTVYNCALLSGMTVTERHRHSLAVSYVEPSFDAMVSFSYADLRFINDSGEKVYLVADADGNRVRVRIYGLPNCYRYERISVVNELIAPLPDEIVYTSDLPFGEKKQMVYPKNGIKSAGVIEKYRGETLVEKRILVTDEYSSLRGITLVGGAGDTGNNSQSA